MSKHHRHLVTVHAVFFHPDGRVLLCCAEEVKGTPPEPKKEHCTKWKLPGGHVEEGLALDEALQREVFEELGPDLRYGPLLLVGAYSLIGGSEDKISIILTAVTQDIKSKHLRRGKPQDEVKFSKWFGYQEALNALQSNRWKHAIADARKVFSGHRPALRKL